MITGPPPKFHGTRDILPLFAGPIGPRAVNLTGHKIYPNGVGLMRYS
jgi:hypothetical protein